MLQERRISGQAAGSLLAPYLSVVASPSLSEGRGNLISVDREGLTRGKTDLSPSYSVDAVVRKEPTALIASSSNARP